MAPPLRAALVLALFATACSGSTPEPETAPAAETKPRRFRSRLDGAGKSSAQKPPGETELASARAAAEAGDLTESIAQARAAIAANPQLEEAYLFLGNACGLAGDTTCEGAAYDDGLTALPNSAALMRERGLFLVQSGAFEEAIAQLEALRKRSAKPSPPLLADLSAAYRNAGQLDQARAMANEALRLDSTCGECHLASGLVAFEANDYAAAETAFAAASRYLPDNLRARVLLAKAVYFGGDAPRAANMYLELVEAAPDSIELRVEAAKLLLKVDRPADAALQLEAAATYLPGEPALQEMLAKVYSMAGQEKKAAAAAAKARALRASP